jgi:excisionase family DNA binding protein
MEKLLVSIPEAVQISGLSRSALYERLSEGSIRAVKAGRKTLICTASLRTWAASLPSFKPAIEKGN